jgi:outer membrane receptor protein involved in Fe transport
MPRLLQFLFPVLLGTCVPAHLLAQLSVTGRVVESGGQPVEFATVMLADRADSSQVAGTTTDMNGRFRLKTPTEAVYAEISFIGYETRRITELPTASGGEIDLGIVELSVQGQTLDEITVRAEKSTTEFRLDKRVFNVGQDLSSTGASALDVLQNVPSVNVTIEGDIRLRGAGGVQILINGKPSVVASDGGNILGTLTADMIESVEVITNPSAKYDAEGTSGIINIVLKKEERKGLNGAVSVNTGVPDNHSVGLSLNRRSEKFNLFSQFGVGYRELPEDQRNVNRNRITGTSVLSEGEEFRNETFYNVVLGTDYYLNERNIFTLSGNFAYEIEDQPSAFTFRRQLEDGTTTSVWNRSETTDATNPKYQFELQYVREWPEDEEHQLVVSALGTLFSKDQSSVFLNETVSGEDNSGRQRTRTEFGEQENTFKLDYTRPISEEFTVETGAQYVTNDVSNDFAVSDFLNDVFVDNSALTNVFDWNQRVAAGYGTAAYELGEWGLKVGLRLERTDLETVLQTTDERNEQNYTNLFPSAAASYKLTEATSFQASYSRRIFRPRLWDLNPFFNIRNNFTIRTGNPNLLPEYADSYELTGIFIMEQASLNASVYHRYTTDVVERVTTFEEEVSITQPVNLGTNRTTGLEVNGKYTPAEWFTLTGDFNYNAFVRDGELEGTSFDFSANQWFGRMTAKFDLPWEVDFETTGNYNSRVQTVQGQTSGFAFLDLGLRKRLFGGRGAVNFAVRDVFASRIREVETSQEAFYQYRRELRGTFVMLGFSYGFGKGETMEYLGQRRR